MKYDNHIIQIMPAPGWCAVYREEDGSLTREDLVAWGVTQEGSVVPLDVAHDDGEVDIAANMSNFVRIERTWTP